MMLKRGYLSEVLLVAALSVVTTAYANDSIANLTTGGVELSQTDAIAMRSETLFISLDEIRVDYEFENLTAENVTLIVAFPLPDLTPDFYNGDFAKADFSENFTTVVNGSPIQMMVEHKAYLKEKDASKQIEAVGLPLNPELAKAKLKTFSLKRKKDLRKQGMIDELGPQWTYRTRFYREQLFPAGEIVKVSHTYKPSVGLSLGLDLTSENKVRYCMDKNLINTLTQKAKGITYYVDYVLSSGGNWAQRKIGRFRLILDKGKPENLVSFCGTQVQEISPTQLEMLKHDFAPDKDLHIMIISPQ